MIEFDLICTSIAHTRFLSGENDPVFLAIDLAGESETFSFISVEHLSLGVEDVVDMVKALAHFITQ